jgi:hypothetical protein
MYASGSSRSKKARRRGTIRAGARAVELMGTLLGVDKQLPEVWLFPMQR